MPAINNCLPLAKDFDAESFRREVERRGWTYKHLGRVSGVAGRSITGWAADEHTPPQRRLDAVMAVIRDRSNYIGCVPCRSKAGRVNCPFCLGRGYVPKGQPRSTPHQDCQSSDDVCVISRLAVEVEKLRTEIRALKARLGYKETPVATKPPADQGRARARRHQHLPADRPGDSAQQR